MHIGHYPMSVSTWGQLHMPHWSPTQGPHATYGQISVNPNVLKTVHQVLTLFFCRLDDLLGLFLQFQRLKNCWRKYWHCTKEWRMNIKGRRATFMPIFMKEDRRIMCKTPYMISKFSMSKFSVVVWTKFTQTWRSKRLFFSFISKHD